MTALDASSCELCRSSGGEILWHDDFCRIVLADEPGFPGFCRVILDRHVKEMTDLPPNERARLMRAVFATEAALRDLLQADKINLASLGNAVPHLHWHVIPRYRDDSRFPAPVWAAPAREDELLRASPDSATLASRIQAHLK